MTGVLTESPNMHLETHIGRMHMKMKAGTYRAWNARDFQ
jgi:hypothetical protein